MRGKIANGWQASAIITYQSGFPIRVQDQNDTELQSSIFFESTNTPSQIGPVQFLNPRTNSNDAWFDTSSFCDPSSAPTVKIPVCPKPYGNFGNTPHALCCGPALSNTDLVIAKRTPITEKINTEFRAEFYNTWNHTEFTNPDGNFSSSTFGLVLEHQASSRDAVWLENSLLTPGKSKSCCESVSDVLRGAFARKHSDSRGSLPPLRETRRKA